jgi:hypothetical protein
MPRPTRTDAAGGSTHARETEVLQMAKVAILRSWGDDDQEAGDP